jgi:WD40-like Beta Propeller Repeat
VTRAQLAAGTLLVVLMAGFGLGVHTALGLVRQVRPGSGTPVGGAPTALAAVRPAVSLPGTVYLTAGGDLVRLRGDTLSVVLRHDASHRWMQPAVAPDGSLVVVSRGTQSSDLYAVSANGTAIRRLTDDDAPPLRDGSLERDHWAFQPRPGRDGRIWFAYDAPKAGFRVDLAVWSRPARGGWGTRWSTPQEYTGGDLDPVPLASGGVVFARFGFDAQEHIVSRLWLQTSLHDLGRPLTAALDDCGQPDLSPAGGMLAMVCTQEQQTAHVEVASFNGRALGVPRRLTADELCAYPTWAPDGRSLVYLGPASGGQGFALWWLDASSVPPQARQVLDGIDLDATSRPAWAA